MKDRFIGSLLGTAIGDTLGAPVEGMSMSAIKVRYGKVWDFLPTRFGKCLYTDDTQMTLALASSLVETGTVDPRHCAESYAGFYEGWRGYGPGAAWILRELGAGADHTRTGRSQFKDGSYGDGGAMRIAPVGLVYRNKDDDELRTAVYDAIMCTHVHPEGVDGAVVQAKAVGILANTKDPLKFDPAAFLETAKSIAGTTIMREKLGYLQKVLEHDIDDATAVRALGNGIRASEAVSCALLATLKYYALPEEAVIRSVGFGGDTDTIGAMAGAQVGALHGVSWIPERWFEGLENKAYGRDYIIALATKLSEIDI